MCEKIKKMYEEWCGEDRHVNDCHPVHDSSDAIEFAEYCNTQIEQENEELKKENKSHVKLIQGAIASAKDYEKRIKVLDIALEKAAKCLVKRFLSAMTAKDTHGKSFGRNIKS